ncbi:MAG: iron-sulfur cluster repair di-iron protein [Actinobacteria bacterium]|nr:iron-sulfur cluster repair di-iron protein [Actinomycetota bacterium]
MSSITPDTTLADIVTNHPDLARELERRSLDYCCGGRKSLAEACEPLGLDPTETAAALSGVTTATPEPWADLGPSELVEHLLATHHAYLHEELPRLGFLADKVATVHGANHPELAQVRDTFTEMQAELDQHLAKEEQILFPAIQQLAGAPSGATLGGTLEGPISVMMLEHDAQGEYLARLRDLTDGYTTPADGCASYQALYQGLAQLESDTHTHVHKENNRLFPMVVELEQHPISS